MRYILETQLQCSSSELHPKGEKRSFAQSSPKQSRHSLLQQVEWLAHGAVAIARTHPKRGCGVEPARQVLLAAEGRDV